MHNLLHPDITGKIIKAFYTIYNTLGFGFLEKVYENALAIELRNTDLRVSQQQPVKVYYDGQLVGVYYADLIIENSVIVELKAAETLYEAQLLNYLKATEIEVGMLLNFGMKPEYKRKIFTNNRKRLTTDDTDLTDLERII
jgi:GxxExxY protein